MKGWGLYILYIPIKEIFDWHGARPRDDGAFLGGNTCINGMSRACIQLHYLERLEAIHTGYYFFDIFSQSAFEWEKEVGLTFD